MYTVKQNTKHTENPQIPGAAPALFAGARNAIFFLRRTPAKKWDIVTEKKIEYDF